MRTTKFSSIAIAMLMTISCFFLSNNVNLYASSIDSVFRLICDPRDIIQTMASITVVQRTPEQLQVTVIRMCDETIVYQTSSSAQEINFSTQGWQKGAYVIETNCPHNDYQEFSFEL